MNKLMLALAFFLVDVNAAYIDLSGGDVVAKALCTKEKKQYLCVAVSHNDLMFVVLVDEKGEYEIYLAEDDKSTLIWARDMI